MGPDAISRGGQAGIRTIPIETYDWACSAARRVETFVDFARTYRLELEADAELAAFQAVILDQDHPIAECQRPEEFPVDLSAELHIVRPDRASIAYRRRLAELAGELARASA